MIKFKSNKSPTYIKWTSETLSIRDRHDTQKILKQLMNQLIKYAHNNNLTIISHAYVHDNSNDYYDWVLSAILEK